MIRISKTSPAIAPSALGASRCALWLSGDSLQGLANNAAVTTWSDQSGNARNVTLSGAVWKTGVLTGGKGAVYFDGSTTKGVLASLALKSFHTVVAVAIGDAANTNCVFCEHGADANSNDGHYVYSTGIVNRRTALTSANVVANQNPMIEAVGKVLAFQFNCRNVGLRVNGQPMIASTTVGATGGSTTTAQYNLACRNQASLFWKGHIAEFAIFDGPVSAFDLANIEQYFHLKYSI